MKPLTLFFFKLDDSCFILFGFWVAAKSKPSFLDDLSLSILGCLSPVFPFKQATKRSDLVRLKFLCLIDNTLLLKSTKDHNICKKDANLV